MLPLLLAPLFGAFYGVAELIPRYRDAPGRALRTWSAATYIVINAGASLAALALFRTLDFSLGLPPGSRRDVGQVLLAGFAAMAVFRSAFFIARVGDENVLVGPLTVVQAGLDASDRGVDRRRALSRSADVVDAMEGVSFRQAFVDLPQLAFNLMQNVGDLEKKRLADAANKMETSDFDDKTKVYVLGLALMRLTGRDALKAAVGLLPSEPAGAASVSPPATLGTPWPGVSMTAPLTSVLYAARPLPRSLQDVKTKAGVDGADLISIVTALQDRGLVRLADNGDDIDIELTAAGAAMLERSVRDPAADPAKGLPPPA